MKLTFATALICLWTLEASAQMRVLPGDFYIRSDKQGGGFTGYHRLLTAPEDGYLPATYCDRKFWVRKTTVLWTEKEVTAGRKLVIEVTKDTGRELVCENPDRYVRLETLGLAKKEIDFLRGEFNGRNTTRGRLSHISKAFKNN